MKDYLSTVISEHLPREDYHEFIRLAHVFLGGTPSHAFRTPGATHHARWMAKGTYVLKVFLFRHQFHLTQQEEKAVTTMALFVSLVYIRFWNEAALPTNAAANDLKLLKILKDYPNQRIGAAAHAALSRHLWFISEHLVALSLFDDRLSVTTKAACVARLDAPAKSGHPRRVKLTEGETEVPLLQEFFTSRSVKVFNLLKRDGAREANEGFLKKDPATWEEDESFHDLKRRAKSLLVVNDTAERGIALIKKYNATLTKDEEQKQYILRLVCQHRKDVPTPSKKNLQ